MSSFLLSVNRLSKSFGSHEVLKELSFSIQEGEIIGLFGRTGSGKSTFARCISLLDPQYSGELQYKGKNLKNIRKTEYVSIRREIQMVFQNPAGTFNPRKLIGYSLREPLIFLNKGEDFSVDEIIGNLIKRVGLRSEHLERYPHELSGGELQRAALVRVLSISPSLIIADEPTSMLDVSVQAHIIRLMLEFQKDRNISFIIISHDPEILLPICDKIAILESGILKMINPEEWFDDIKSKLE